MATKKSSAVAKSEKAHKTPECRALPIAERGIEHGHQFAEFMSAMMSDVVTGAMTPDVVNAACNAGGKLLKIVEMQLKYGVKGQSGLTLTGPQA
jgi:hypothetical protein